MKGLVVVFLLLVGCTTGYLELSSVVESPDGTVKHIRSVLKAPKASLGDSYVTLTSNGVFGAISGAQDVATIEDAKGSSAGKKIIYGGLALVMLLSVAALFLPASIISNKDALIGFACALAGFVVVRYVEASAGIMGWLIPVFAVGCVVYLAWLWARKEISP